MTKSALIFGAAFGFIGIGLGYLAGAAQVDRARDLAFTQGVTEGAKQQALKQQSWKECLLGEKK